MNILETTCSRCGESFEYEMPESEETTTDPDSIDWSAALVKLKPNICKECDKRDAARFDAEWRAREESDRLHEVSLRNVPSRYRVATFENFKTDTASQAKALDVVRCHSDEGVLLVGPAGCGKTHLAAAAISTGPLGGLFVGATELLDDMRRGFDGNGRGLFERAMSSPLLVLDDLGQEATTDWVRDRLYTLVNHRWNEELPLIVTSNHGPDTLADRIGSGTASRVIGICTHRVKVEGVDRRKRAS